MSLKKSFVYRVYIFFILILFFSCSKKKVFEDKDVILKNKAVNEYFDSLSIEEKVCQLFIVNLVGDTDFLPVEKYSLLFDEKSKSDDNSSLENKKLFEKAMIPGGYLFFSYNISKNPETVMKFTDSIKNYCIENNLIIPFLAVDQEGGYVNRLKGLCGPLPSQKRVSENLSLELAAELYALQAKQMKSLGFNMNVAPVVEVETEMNRDFLDGRSFGNMDTVLSYSKKCISSYKKNGIACVIKHFPGNTNVDPHLGLPKINLQKEDLNDLVFPFKEIVTEKPAGVLMSHAIVNSIDENVPSCLSKKWVKETLCDEYGFNGIVFSDDIFMDALNKNGYPPEKACVDAIEAGVTCIMISQKRFSLPAGVLLKKACENEDFRKKIDDACRKIIEEKIKNGILVFQENQNGEYKIENSQFLKNYDERLIEYKLNFDSNVNLYRQNFY